MAHGWGALDSLRGSREGPEAEDLGTFGSREATHVPLSSKDAVAGPSLAWSDLVRVEARLQDRSLSLDERQRLKDMKHWRLARPWPELSDEMYEELASVALEFGQNRIRVEELVRDPDHGGTVDDNSIDEARIALAMEREGGLREVIRDPRVGCGDLIEKDGTGQEWDVYSPRGDRFDQQRVKEELREKLADQSQDDRMIKVILNSAYLSREQVGEIERVVEIAGWGEGSSGTALRNSLDNGRIMDLKPPTEDFLRWLEENHRERRKRRMPPPASKLDLSRTRLTEVDFSGLGYEDCSFEGSGLRSADLASTGLYDCSFRGADLSEAWFTKAQVHDCDFRECSFVGAKLPKIMAHHSDFRGADFTGAGMARAAFHHCDFRQARLVDLELKGTAFHDCALAGADFTGSRGTLHLYPINVGSPEAPQWIDGDEALAWFRASGATDISGTPVAKPRA